MTTKQGAPKIRSGGEGRGGEGLKHRSKVTSEGR